MDGMILHGMFLLVFVSTEMITVLVEHSALLFIELLLHAKPCIEFWDNSCVFVCM